MIIIFPGLWPSVSWLSDRSRLQLRGCRPRIQYHFLETFFWDSTIARRIAASVSWAGASPLACVTLSCKEKCGAEEDLHALPRRMDGQVCETGAPFKERGQGEAKKGHFKWKKKEQEQKKRYRNMQGEKKPCERRERGLRERREKEVLNRDGEIEEVRGCVKRQR